MKVWHPWQLKKKNSWGPFCSYQLNRTAYSAHFAQFLGIWAKLAVLFSWYLQSGPQDFDFFNCHWCQTFILYEIHCYLSPPKSLYNNSVLGHLQPNYLTLSTQLLNAPLARIRSLVGKGVVETTHSV